MANRPRSILDSLIESDSAVSSRYSDFYRAWWSGQIPANTTYDFPIEIPEGIDLFGFSRVTTVLDGRVNTSFLVGGEWSPGDVEYTQKGYLFDERNGGVRSQPSLLRVTGLSGASTRTPAIPIIAPSTGAVRTPSAQTESGLIPSFRAPHYPVFRYQNPGGSAVQLYLQVTWQEMESPNG